MEPRTSQTLRCSFCGQTQKQVTRLISGPGVFICNECIHLCNEIIEDDESVLSWPWHRIDRPIEPKSD